MTPVPRGSVDVHLGKGEAEFEVEDLEVPDFGTLLNALRGGESVPAEVSFEVRWGDPIRRERLRDAEDGFAGHFIETHAAIEWSARQGGFKFVSDDMETSSSTFAVIALERNGVFFG